MAEINTDGTIPVQKRKTDREVREATIDMRVSKMRYAVSLEKLGDALARSGNHERAGDIYMREGTLEILSGGYEKALAQYRAAGNAEKEAKAQKGIDARSKLIDRVIHESDDRLTEALRRAR